MSFRNQTHDSLIGRCDNHYSATIVVTLCLVSKKQESCNDFSFPIFETNLFNLSQNTPKRRVKWDIKLLKCVFWYWRTNSLIHTHIHLLATCAHKCTHWHSPTHALKCTHRHSLAVQDMHTFTLTLSMSQPFFTLWRNSVTKNEQ